LTNSLALLADAAHMLTAFLEVLSDALGSVGVIIEGVTCWRRTGTMPTPCSVC
jgi:Co/Zn/Cd efflux system component